MGFNETSSGEISSGTRWTNWNLGADLLVDLLIAATNTQKRQQEGGKGNGGSWFEGSRPSRG